MPNQEDFAIVVGINRYPAIRPLFGAEKDAASFAAWLGKSEGGDLPPENIRLILSANFPEPVKDFFAKPVKEDIDAAFIDFGIEDEERVGRRLYFFFAGHGVSPSFDDVVLLMANASKNRLRSNIGVQKYRSYLHDAAPFDELVIILDCCREFEDHAEPVGPVFTQRLAMDRAPLVKEYFLMASEYGKRAFEPQAGEPDDRRGLLSRAILEGLEERKAADPQNAITAASLTAYITRRLPELATETRLKQKPEIPQSPDMVICPPSSSEPGEILAGEAKVTIVVEAALGGEVLLQTNTLDEIERRAWDATPWQVQLKPGVYVLSHQPSGQQKVVDARKPQEVPNEFRFS